MEETKGSTLHASLFPPALRNIKFIVFYTDLKPGNIKEVLDQTWEYRARWKFVGIALDIHEDTLDAIEANNPRNVADCLREMIYGWLKSTNPRPTRGAMRVALQSKLVSNAAGSVVSM